MYTSVNWEYLIGFVFPKSENTKSFGLE